MKSKEAIIRHLERRIAKCNKHADRAYRMNHNIIAVGFLNKACRYEITLERIRGEL